MGGPGYLLAAFFDCRKSGPDYPRLSGSNSVFIETGSLSVHYEDDAGRVRLAILGAGSAVGEGGFFSHLPRSATVQAVSACKLWRLTPMKFAELSNRQPVIALALSWVWVVWWRGV